LSSSSPAIGASSASYPSILNIVGLNNDSSILFDIEGQSRPSTITLKDVGCDQFTTGTIVNYPLDSCQAGPFYLCQNITANNTLAYTVNSISVYPNPSNGQFTIALPTDNAAITVTDILGQQILKGQVTQKTTDLQLDNNGVYIVYITTKQGTTTRKLIVNH